MNSKSLIGSLAIALVVAAGLWFYFGYAPSLSQAPAKIELAGKGIEQLPEFEFQDLEGNPRSSSEWKGKVLVVNEISGARFYDLLMLSDSSGRLTIQTESGDSEIYFIVTSVPDTFTDVEQVYGYQLMIERDT